jgi:hypothetical protein
MMYNIYYECRYHKDDVFLEKDDVNEYEKEYIRDVLYREDLLNIFYINDDDAFEKFNTLICDLYKKLYLNDDLRECMREVAYMVISENEETGLCLLFSYDLMHLTHKCVCEYLQCGKVSEINLKLLKGKIKSK